MKHILMIEPDTLQALAIAKMLTHESWQLHFASNAQSAITAADAYLPATVILELAIPGHNGIEFLHEFRSYSEWTEVPIIIFSQQDISKFASWEDPHNIPPEVLAQHSLAIENIEAIYGLTEKVFVSSETGFGMSVAIREILSKVVNDLGHPLV